MNILSIIVIGMICISASFQQNIQDNDWLQYIAKHGKSYSENEEAVRYQIWASRAAEIDNHNSQPGVSYQRDLHNHADYLPEEIASRKGVNLPTSKRGIIQVASMSPANSSIPSALDWRQKRYVTPVKDQGQCGSCWTFSSTGALEGQYFKKYNSLKSFSEQEFVDCVNVGSSDGCNGGWMSDAFDFSTNGITLESKYPYVSGETETAGASCKYKASTAVAKTKSTSNFVVGDDENQILNNVVSVGPLAITVCANDKFMSYSSGVFTDSPCDNSSPNHTVDHAVLLVGYGTDPNYGDYWIVKNSWAASWGESGYIRIARGQQLINNAIYPILA